MTPGRRAVLYAAASGACSGFLLWFGYRIGATSPGLVLLTLPGALLARKAGWWERQESILAAFRRLGVPTDDEVQS
jgi:cytochrome c biogenesis protein CcdA